MTYKSHLAGAFVGASITVPFVGLQGPVIGLLFAAALLGGVIPDADESESWISRQCYPLHWCFILVVGNPLFFVIFGRRKMLRMLAHRGITHSLVGFVFAGVLTTSFLSYVLYAFSFITFELPSRIFGYLMPWQVTTFSGADVLAGLVYVQSLEGILLSAEVGLMMGLFFSVGYVSHIFLDMMTRSGCPLLCPFRTRRYYLLPKSLRFTTSTGFAR
jgi:membrane-bound metal-dependent hydrolase YbcI (DUF457 family)